MHRHRPALVASALLALLALTARPAPAAAPPAGAPLAGKRVLWVDSYNRGYEWSDGIERGLRQTLHPTGVVFETFRMQAKDCSAAPCFEAAARRAADAVSAFKPDVLIASDDIAQKHLVVPRYLNTGLPVVFCGVNWDAAAYGYPAPNVTGMIEVDLIEEAVAHMRRYAAGDRIGYISGDTVSDRKIIEWLDRLFFKGKMHAVRVADFAQFKQAFDALQQDVDMLFIRNYAGIAGWDATAAGIFLAQHTRIPTASNNDFMAPYVVFTLGKVPEEQGQFAAAAAIEILGGRAPGAIPIARNQKANLTLNLKMARSAGIVLPLPLLKIARVIGAEAYSPQAQPLARPPVDLTGRRVLWVDSYHKGYEWSDGIEEGLREVFTDTGLAMEVFRMDTKRHGDEAWGRAAAARAAEVVAQFRPDVLIASDDNAQKFLVAPRYLNTALPVVFCGVNWDASMYGYPAANVTGMIEVEQALDLAALMRRFARGDRLGFLSGDLHTERKIAAYYNQRFFDGRMAVYLVDNFAAFQERFLLAQTDVDMLLVNNYTGIADWDPATAEQFVAAHTRIPTGSANPFMDRLAIFTLAKVPQEQGRHAANTALRILDGTKPSDIPVATNTMGHLTINLRLAKSAALVVPVSLIRKARLIGQQAID